MAEPENSQPIEYATGRMLALESRSRRRLHLLAKCFGWAAAFVITTMTPLPDRFDYRLYFGPRPKWIFAINVLGIQFGPVGREIRIDPAPIVVCKFVIIALLFRWIIARLSRGRFPKSSSAFQIP